LSTHSSKIYINVIITKTKCNKGILLTATCPRTALAGRLVKNIKANGLQQMASTNGFNNGLQQITMAFNGQHITVRLARTVYMNVNLAASLPKIPYIHRMYIYRVGQDLIYI
jgi:hypothetical protein